MSDPCKHGVSIEDRRLTGCDDCDHEDMMARHAEMEQGLRRARVVETARAILPQFIRFDRADMPYYVTDIFAFAEGFEKQADEYLRGGKAP
jgi:hypothetical protein